MYNHLPHQNNLYKNKNYFFADCNFLQLNLTKKKKLKKDFFVNVNNKKKIGELH